MLPVAIFLRPAVTAGPSNDGTFNLKLNSSFSSKILSTITGTLTLLIVIPLANVAVSVVVLKSTPPISQTLFSFKATLLYNTSYVPFAEIGDLSDKFTVTVNGLADIPPNNSKVTNTNPAASEPVYFLDSNLTTISTNT